MNRIIPSLAASCALALTLTACNRAETPADVAADVAEDQLHLHRKDSLVFDDQHTQIRPDGQIPTPNLPTVPP